MNRSTLIAAAILVALIAWFGFNSLKRGSLSSHQEVVHQEAGDATPEAVVMTVTAEPHLLKINVKGRTAPDKSVTVKAGTSGNVVATPAKEGSFVKAGTLLCGLDVEARAARVKEAEASRDAARADYNAAASLAAKGLGAANNATAAKARLDAAEAAVNSAKVELGKTQIRAPFDGIFETRLAEAGDFLAPGSACGVLVDMDPVIVSAQLTEQQAGYLATGMDGDTRLANGKTYPVSLRYVARTADGPTRTFLVEAAIASGDDAVPAGITAELFVPIGEVPATKISAGLLTLSDDGQLGVRYVEADNTVRFVPVNVIDETPDGIWVSGLPQSVQLISLGQDYLSEGVTVKPVPSRGAQP
ncbi:MAG: efflux RND transporter periplasmic adaptor subunit [Hyphomonas sp.]|uniref:efflux RND transporter periplasmic adaptor subunit n=1 Tax=Hyphomonas sp. TaxID=87 RepID=UPI0035281988